MSRRRIILVTLLGAGLIAVALVSVMAATLADELEAPLPTLPVGTPPVPDPDATMPPVPTDTPTITPTPTPQPVHLPMVIRELRGLENGDFEQGRLAPHWESTGDLNAQMVSGGLPRSGRYAVLLGDPKYDSAGGCPVGDARLVQVIDVPSSGHPTLRVWYRIWSEDTLDYDFFAIDIADSNGDNPDRLHLDGCTLWTGNLWSSGWREAIVSLDNYRGQTVRVELINALTNTDGWYNTWTYVDDLRLDPER